MIYSCCYVYQYFCSVLFLLSSSQLYGSITVSLLIAFGTPGDGAGQGGLPCYSPRGRKVWDTTRQLKIINNFFFF